MVIFHGELLVITRWYVNKRPTIMRHFPEHKPLETVSGLNLKNPWFCRVSDSPVHRCWIPNIVNSSGIIVTSSNSQMNPLPIGVLKVDFHGCVFSSLLQVMQNKQHCTVTGCFLTMSMTVIDWLRPHNVNEENLWMPMLIIPYSWTLPPNPYCPITIPETLNSHVTLTCLQKINATIPVTLPATTEKRTVTFTWVYLPIGYPFLKCVFFCVCGIPYMFRHTQISYWWLHIPLNPLNMDDSDIDTVFYNIYSGDDSSNIVSSKYSIYSGWWFQLLWKILHSQWEGLSHSHILWKIKTVWNHQPDIYHLGKL